MEQPALNLTLPTRFDSGVRLEQPDHIRLGAQLVRVLAVMADEQWRTVEQLKADILARFGVKDPEPSISAQLRNARKSKHGGHQVERRRVGAGYQFRLCLPCQREGV